MLKSLFNIIAGLKICIFFEKRLQYRFFPVNIREFSRTSILKNICEWMLLSRSSKCSNKSTAIVTCEHPNHKSKIVSPPPGAFSKPDIYCRKGWQCIQDICNEFPSQCKEKYLQSFQEFQKWEDKKRNFKIGDIVIVYQVNVSKNR